MIKLATVFSGIGAVEHALERLKIPYEIVFDCDNGERRLKTSYETIAEEKFYQDVKLLDGTEYRDQVDLFVGGSPCQSFSIMGKHGGLEEARGTLFYEYARLVEEIQPKVFIYENVTGMLKHDGGRTWDVIQNIFNTLGYS